MQSGLEDAGADGGDVSALLKGALDWELIQNPLAIAEVFMIPPQRSRGCT